ncbi:MAG: hypothetical protein LBU42_03130 [Prevotellaceae bacterium]|jgi:hypothetical protein|nr:hypothetical protein [Prevotellaceae bacterium]
METIKEAAEKYAEEHAFRVPYNGTSNFYDETDYKASMDGFLAGSHFIIKIMKTINEAIGDT